MLNRLEPSMTFKRPLMAKISESRICGVISTHPMNATARRRRSPANIKTRFWSPIQ
jgi:hypothetical protein